MRHWLVLVLFLLGLGTLRLVACGDEEVVPEYPLCLRDEHCDDSNACTFDSCVWSSADEPWLCEHWEKRCPWLCDPWYKPCEEGEWHGQCADLESYDCDPDTGVVECTWGRTDLHQGQGCCNDEGVCYGPEGGFWYCCKRRGYCIDGACVEGNGYPTDCTERDDGEPCDIGDTIGLCWKGTCVTLSCEGLGAGTPCWNNEYDKGHCSGFGIACQRGTTGGGPWGWTCAGEYYGAADGCDCGCGIIDPDCADGTVASCDYCGLDGSCSFLWCPGDIDPAQNCTCGTGGSCGVPGWVAQRSGTTVWLWDVSFTDANTGTAVGNGGTILRTTNGGRTWTRQFSDPRENLFGVSFVDANTGTIVGTRRSYPPNIGTVLRTTNGGATWVVQDSGTTSHLFGVSFADANTGTVVGHFGTILGTTDGGATWTRQDSGTSNHLFGVSFTDAHNGTIVGELGTILRTTDGGATWTAQSSGTSNTLFDVSFTDANNGTVVGSSGTILRTTDGGATWVAQNSGTTNTLEGVSFTDANTGTVVGNGGTIVRTTDGGATWVAQDSGTTSHLESVSFVDADNGTVVGYDGTILRTTDGGGG